MQAGVCVGVTGVGDCSGTGWSPWYLLDATLLGYVDAYNLIATTDIGGGVLDFAEIVCPYCLLDRADAAGIPGFNRQKYTRIKSYLDGLNCIQTDQLAKHPRSWSGHVHLFDFAAENVWPARATKPAPGERSY